MPLEHPRIVIVKNRYIFLAVVLLLVGCTIFAITSRTQRKQPTQNGDKLKLEYSNPDLKSDNYTPPAVAPIPMSSDRLLVPVGDTLYMLDSPNHIVWNYPFEPNIIRDVMVDPKGDIYITASEALILVLNASGKEIWRTA